MLDKAIIAIGRQEKAREKKELEQLKLDKIREQKRNYNIKNGIVKNAGKKERHEENKKRVLKYLQEIQLMDFIEYQNGKEIKVTWEYYFKTREIKQIKELMYLEQLNNYNDYLKFKKLMEKVQNDN